MSDTTFVNSVTLTDADWFNDVNRLHYTIFGDPANLAAVIALLRTNALAGQVLQVLSQIDSGSSHNGTTLLNLNTSQVNFTPKSTSSVLIIEVQFAGQASLVTATNTVATFSIFEITASAYVSFSNVLTAATETIGVNTQAPCFLRARITNTALTPRAFVLHGAINTGAATVFGVNQQWTITEIKA